MFAKTKTARILFAVIMLLIAMQVILYYTDCIRVETRYLGGLQIEFPDVEISYDSLCGRFALVMAVFRAFLLIKPSAGRQIAAGVLSALVAAIAGAWPALLSLKGFMGGLTATTRELTALGIIALVLSWIVVAAQAGMLIGTLATTPKPADGSRKKYASWIWLMGAALLVLILIVFRDIIYDVIKWLFRDPC